MRKIVLALFVAVGFASCNNEKTAYVDTSRLVQEYSEMKDVESDFTVKSEKIKKELDSVAQSFQAEVKEYQENMSTLSNSEKKETESKLMKKQQMLQQQQQMVSNQLRSESDAAIDSLVTKVKGFVKDFGKDHGYTYIFGSNESANIMYAKDGLDITQEILDKLNSETGIEKGDIPEKSKK